MLSKRDYIYYDYIFGNIKSKKLKWKLYCKLRKLITISEKQSKVWEWTGEKLGQNLKKYLGE